MYPLAQKIILDVKGPKEVKAKDITLVSEVEILNPDLTICNVDEKTNFHMELFVNSRKGYVPAPKNRSEDSPLGLISMNSLFSPVKKFLSQLKILEQVAPWTMTS